MFTASSDFEALVQSQMLLAVQTLGVISAVLYLAQTTPGGESQWVELISYPQGTPASLPLLLPPATGSIVRQERIVIPLVYEEVMVGLLISEKDQTWTPIEQRQIEEIAHTLAIACTLDQRCQWLLSQQEQRYSQEQDFLANLLHQIKNPITAIRTFGQLLLKRIRPSDPNHPIVEGLVHETVHLQELLRTTPLLKPSPQQLLLPPAPTELGQVLAPLISSFAELAQSKQLRFNALFPDREIFIKAQGGALREALGNILDNAWKYTPPGGEISLSLELHRQTCQIIIQDTGVGIPQGDLPQIFQRHFRGNQSQGPIEGSGLGLAIAKQLLEDMGATIGIQSEEGKGTKITITLPLHHS